MSQNLDDRAGNLQAEINQHKNDFLTWKLKNQSKEGTEAYEKYVAQFHQWEKTALKQLEEVREQIAAQSLEKEEQDQVLKQMAVDAALYELHQKSYLDYHQKALEQEQKAAEALTHAARQMSASRESSNHLNLSNTASDASFFNTFVSGLQTAMGILDAGEVHEPEQCKGDEMRSYYGIEAFPPPLMPPLPMSYAEKVEYDESDPMFRKWGVHAAPPNHPLSYDLANSQQRVDPGWILASEMKEKNLMFNSVSNLPPVLPTASASYPPPALRKTFPAPQQGATMGSVLVEKPADRKNNSNKNVYFIPKGWLEYKPIGRDIENTPFVPFKTPLKAPFTEAGKKKLVKFDLDDLLECAQRANQRFGLIIDLTGTERYYDRTTAPLVFGDEMVHKKIASTGHDLDQDQEKYQEFKATVDEFRSGPQKDLKIGVHCTHGLNRTGFMICRYMIEEMAWNAQEAILAFDKARGAPMERENYITTLRTIGEGLGQTFNNWDEVMVLENRKLLAANSDMESWMDEEAVGNFERFRSEFAKVKIDEPQQNVNQDQAATVK